MSDLTKEDLVDMLWTLASVASDCHLEASEVFEGDERWEKFQNGDY